MSTQTDAVKTDASKAANKQYVTTAYNPDDYLRHLCKLSFRRFVKEFWEHVPGAGQLIWNWHLDVICDELQYVAERVFKGLPKEHDVVVNVPPGSSKSTIGSILFQAWCWARMPSSRHICGSHSLDLALDLATKCRDVMRSELYRRLFPEIVVTDEQDTKAYYRNTAGGDRYTCTVGGRSPIGFHAHFQCIDDPIDPKEVLSEQKLEEARNFFTNHLPGRKVNREITVTILIMQRLGVGDSTDVMMEISRREGAAPVRHVCIPAELTEDVNPVEVRESYTDGVMDMKRFPKHVLERERATMGEHAYQTQFLQRASVPGGSKFKEQWFNQRKKVAPFNCKRVRYWDRASKTSDTACSTAGVLLAQDEWGHFYVEDVVVGKWEPVERNKKIRATALRDRTRYGPAHEPDIYVEFEGGSVNEDAWIAFRRALTGFPIRQDRPTGDKDTRSDPWASELEAGNVTLIDNGECAGQGVAGWDINRYVDEHLKFRPSLGRKLGRNKDQVDATSGALAVFRKKKPAGGLRTYTFGRSKGGSPFKVILCTREQLAEARIDAPTVLVSIQDPNPDENYEYETPPHALTDLVASVVLPFADVDPHDSQTNEDWEVPDPETGKSPAQLAVQKADCKKLWNTLLKKHAKPFHLIVVQGEDDDRHPSVGMAISDSLHLKRDQALFCLDNDDHRHRGDPPNRYVYDVVRDARRLVLS